MTQWIIQQQGERWLIYQEQDGIKQWEKSWRQIKLSIWRQMVFSDRSDHNGVFLLIPLSDITWHLEIFPVPLEDGLRNDYLEGLSTRPGDVLYWRTFEQGTSVLLSVAVMHIPFYLPSWLRKRIHIYPEILFREEEVPLGYEGLFQENHLLALFSTADAALHREYTDFLLRMNWEHMAPAIYADEGQYSKKAYFSRFSGKLAPWLLLLLLAAIGMHFWSQAKEAEVQQMASSMPVITEEASAHTVYRDVLSAVYDHPLSGVRLMRWHGEEGALQVMGKADNRPLLQTFLDQLVEQKAVCSTTLLEVKDVDGKTQFKVLIQLKEGGS